MHSDPFGRVLAKPKPDPEISNLRNLFRISDSIGMEGRNNRRDIAKVETLLGHLGELNLDETEGVTGYAGARLDEAIRKFQKRHTLKVDGQINPGGETITTTGAVLAASEEEPDEHLIPERPLETRDPMESLPRVPGTLDKNEIIIKDLDDILRIIKKRREKRA